MRSMRTTIGLLLLCTVLPLAACARSAAYRTRPASDRQGPPAHAPAHGYRHKHAKDHVELVFDSSRDVYVVVGFPGTYFIDGVYFRLATDVWETSPRIDGRWEPSEPSSVPPGLRRSGAEAPPGKGRGQGR